ncbi:MAG TPA: hypothetical protein VFZ42_14680 [Chitinophagaceae bacterium]
MKKLSFLVAVLAVVFAVGSAFSKKVSFAETGYFEVKSELSYTVTPLSSDFETSGAVVDPISSFGCLGSTPDGLICARHYTNRDISTEGTPGTIVYKEDNQ